MNIISCNDEWEFEYLTLVNVGRMWISIWLNLSHVEYHLEWFGIIYSVIGVLKIEWIS